MTMCVNTNDLEFMTMKQFLLMTALLAAGSGVLSAQPRDHSKMKHGAGQPIETTTGLPTEPGQSAFAAIQEIVALLEVDPSTDWSKVSIEALRQHLIDMSNVTLGAQVEASASGDAMRFTVSGEGRVRDSIQRMVKAHADTMQGIDGWGFAAELTEAGAILSVTPPDKAAAARLSGLGFIGVMARGMHHQEHHFMIAKGLGPHN